jgi:hypothetical protein
MEQVRKARRYTATVESASGILHTFEVLALDLNGARHAVARKYPGTYLRALRPVN